MNILIIVYLCKKKNKSEGFLVVKTLIIYLRRVKIKMG